MKIAPSDTSYLTFCNIVTGYRLFQIVRHAVQLGVIDAIGPDGASAATVCDKTGVRREEGARFLTLLAGTGVVEQYGELFFLSQFARTYLAGESGLSQGNVLAFEELLAEKWSRLGAVLREGQGALQAPLPDPDYRSRLKLFHDAMHEAAVVRSAELWEALSFFPGEGVIVDAGAGDGTYLRAFLQRYPRWSGVACDLDDVISLGSYGDTSSVTCYPCNLLDPRESGGVVERYRRKASVLLFSNLLHCYGEREGREILGRLACLLRDDGIVVVHDFFSDANDFGALYDGHMLVNTYSGRTYTLDKTKGMLADAGFPFASEFHLPSASCAIVASRKELPGKETDPVPLLRREALSIGFTDARPVAVEEIRPEAWVKAKCHYGCAMFGRRWSCPPHSMDAAGFSELLSCYGRALLVVGQPPLRDFQERLLELEKRAFLRGLKKALVFSGGPCSWCESCPEDRCAFPEKRRPSLESCGCDVFALAARCGIDLQPVQSKDDFVQYVGLLLVD